jgi:hypothetical protein
MPVADVTSLKEPGDLFPVEAGVDVGIVNDVRGIVVVNKIEASHRSVKEEGGEEQAGANPEFNAGTTFGRFRVQGSKFRFQISNFRVQRLLKNAGMATEL